MSLTGFENTVKIYDDFLSDKEFQSLKIFLSSGSFPWYYSFVVDGEKHGLDPKTTKYNFQFVHMLYNNFSPNSEHFDKMLPIIDKLNVFSLLRIKANITTRSSEIVEQGYHTDYPNNMHCVTGVYYVNTTNGFTKFETGEIIEGIGNRMVLFDSRLRHTGTTCTDQDIRCVINFNYIPKGDPIDSNN